MDRKIKDKIAEAECVCGHPRMRHASFHGKGDGRFAGIGALACARRGCKCKRFEDKRRGIMLGAELSEGVIFKYGDGAIKRWLKVNTVGPVSHLKSGNLIRLTAYDRDGSFHRVKVDADADYQVADEFPRRKEKKQPVGVAAEFSHDEENGNNGDGSTNEVGEE